VRSVGARVIVSIAVIIMGIKWSPVEVGSTTDVRQGSLDVAGSWGSAAHGGICETCSIDWAVERPIGRKLVWSGFMRVLIWSGRTA